MVWHFVTKNYFRPELDVDEIRLGVARPRSRPWFKSKLGYLTPSEVSLYLSLMTAFKLTLSKR
jgi:hypothetical protein